LNWLSKLRSLFKLLVFQSVPLKVFRSFWNMLLLFIRVLCVIKHRKQQGIMVYDWIDYLNLGVSSNYSFWYLRHFRLLVHSKTRCYYLQEFFVWECIQNKKSFRINHFLKKQQQDIHPLHLKQLFELRSLFKLLVYFGTHCYCLHDFFAWECIQNNIFVLHLYRLPNLRSYLKQLISESVPLMVACSFENTLLLFTRGLFVWMHPKQQYI